MTCPRCSRSNDPGARFCAHCGASLDDFQASEARISAIIEPQTAAVDAGKRIDVTLSVRNDRHVVEHVDLSLADPEGGWGAIEPLKLRMMPGTSATAVVRLSPPRSASVPAGPHPLRVAVTRSGSGELLTYADARIDVRPFSEVSATISPRHSKGWFSSGRLRIWLENPSNTEVTIRVSGSDPDEKLRFRGLEREISVPPGPRIPADFKARGHGPNLHLRSQKREFSIAAEWGERQKVVASAVFAQRSLIYLIVGLLVALLIAAAAIAVIATHS